MTEAFSSMVCKCGCYLGTGRPVSIAHLYSMTTPHLPSFWKSNYMCQQKQCPSCCPLITLGGHQAPDVSPRRHL